VDYPQAPPTQVPPSGHATQLAPRVPHCAGDGGTQMLLEAQQPLGQFIGPHVELPTHAPPTHRSVPTQARHSAPPCPHAEGSTPLRHTPSASRQPPQPEVFSQVPAGHDSPGAQEVQKRPEPPHRSGRLPAAQPPSGRQQPVRQPHRGGRPPSRGPASGASTHAPALHALPAPHDAHSTPPTPHAPGAVPGRHSPLSQHPAQERHGSTHDAPADTAIASAPITHAAPRLLRMSG